MHDDFVNFVVLLLMVMGGIIIITLVYLGLEALFTFFASLRIATGNATGHLTGAFSQM